MAGLSKYQARNTMEKKSEHTPLTGIVLSGGGVRGMAHIGALQALEEAGIEPDLIAGASAGALVGALYARGLRPRQILDFFKENTNIFRWQHFSRSKPGLLDAELYREMFEGIFPADDFSVLQKPLFISATDIEQARCVLFSSGQLIKPLLASAAFPPLFTPVEIDGHWYVDGGVMNNFPVEPLLERCHFVIGSYVSPVKMMSRDDISNSLRLLHRVNDLVLIAASAAKFSWVDELLLMESLYRYSTFETSKIEEIFDIGYNFTVDRLESIVAHYEHVKQHGPRPRTRAFPCQLAPTKGRFDSRSALARTVLKMKEKHSWEEPK